MSLKPFDKTLKHSDRYSRFHINLTKVHRLQSVESEASKKSFVEEYNKITSSIRGEQTGRNSGRDKIYAKVSQSLDQSVGRSKSTSRYEIVNLKNRHSLNNHLSLHLVKRPQNNLQTSELPKGIRRSTHGSETRSILPGEKEKKINGDFKYTREMMSHFQNLLRIRQGLNKYEENYENIVLSIKTYVFNKQAADVSKLDQLLKIMVEQRRLRQLLSLQKVVILGILDSNIRQNYSKIEKQGKYILDVIIGVYYSIMDYLIIEITQKPELNQFDNETLSLLSNFVKNLQVLNIEKKRQLQTANQFVHKRISALFQLNMDLYDKIKCILDQSSCQGYRLNKIYYQLLCEYAKNINRSGILDWNNNLLDSFASCPSPLLSFPRTCAPFTLVIQFDGVLSSVKEKKGHLVFKLRPYARQLVQSLGKFYEVVVFTGLMPEDLGECPLFQSLNVIALFNYHAIRLKRRLIKDLGRLGRKCEEMILVDYFGNSRYSLNSSNNTLWVDKWKGNPLDEGLLPLSQNLIKIAKKQPKDIRTQLASLQQRKITLKDKLRQIKEDQEEQQQQQGQKLTNCEAEENIFANMRQEDENQEKQKKMYLRRKMFVRKFTYRRGTTWKKQKTSKEFL